MEPTTLVIPIDATLEDAGLNPTTQEQREEMLLCEALGMTFRADLTRLVAHVNTLQAEVARLEGELAETVTRAGTYMRQRSEFAKQRDTLQERLKQADGLLRTALANLDAPHLSGHAARRSISAYLKGATDE